MARSTRSPAWGSGAFVPGMTATGPVPAATRDRRDGTGSAEQESLSCSHAEAAEGLELPGGFYPFGDDLHLDLVRVGAESCDQDALVLVGVDAADEAPIELQQVGRELDDVRESGEPLPDVVDRQPAAQRTKFGEMRVRLLVVHDRRALRELDHHALCRDRTHELGQAGFAERLGRDVHREYTPAGMASRCPSACVAVASSSRASNP